MINETRLSDDQVKAIFKATKRTSEFEVLSIEYTHFDDNFPDKYMVETTGGTYYFCQTKKQNWTSTRTQFYNRICKV